DNPTGQGLLEGLHVEEAEEDGEGGRGGGLAAREAEQVRQGEALVAAELGDGLVALGSREHGHDRQGKDRGQGLASTMARTRTGNRGAAAKPANTSRRRTIPRTVKNPCPLSGPPPSPPMSIFKPPCCTFRNRLTRFPQAGRNWCTGRLWPFTVREVARRQSDG